MVVSVPSAKPGRIQLDEQFDDEIPVFTMQMARLFEFPGAETDKYLAAFLT